jgi:hypothetical protein
MPCWKQAIALSAAVGLVACVAHTHQERVALRMAWPSPPPAALVAYAPPSSDYPSVGGDILKAPADLPPAASGQPSR